jgi:putative ABC transport system permease protein
VKRVIAWRILTHEKGRSALAIVGIFFAVLMIFLQLGFYSSVPAGGMLVYDKMRFDLVLASSAYYFQGQPFAFPRRRLYQALALAEVVSVAPVYQDSAQWFSAVTGLRRDIFVMAFNLRDRVFNVPDIDRQLGKLDRPDVVLVDRDTRPMFGPLTEGLHVEIEDREVTIVGSYELGTGFAGLGVVTTSDLNFIRLFPNRALNTVNLGLVTLRPGSDPSHVARQLRALMPADTSVFTRDEFAQREVFHWVAATSTGLVFGFGAAVSVVVGIVILYQVLATQIRRHLPEYATLKAIGYHDGYLRDIVVTVAVLMASVAYVPAVVASVAIYRIVRNLTLLPIAMTVPRLVAVLLVTLAISIGAAVVSVRGLRRANPVDLF